MSQETMRGMRLGGHSFEDETKANLSPRATHNYRCVNGHETKVVFAAEAELPETWACKSCEATGQLITDAKQAPVALAEDKAPRSHWEMLLERRTIAELEEILQERLDEIRARRGADSL